MATRRGLRRIAALPAAAALTGALVEVEIAGESQQVDASSLGGGVPSTRAINTTAPLAGGGDLSADRTLSLSDAGVTYAKIQNVSATDKLLGRSSAGAGVVQEIACTAAGRNLLDDADAAAQRTTLGLGTMAEWTPTVAATSATSGTMTVNMGEGVRTITPTGACTFNASGGVAGQRCTFAITTSGTTSYTLTFGTNFRKVGTLATGTVTARYFSVTFVCINGTIWQEIGRTAAQT